MALGGDLAFTFVEQNFGRVMPIYLKDLNASNTLIGLPAGSFAGLINVVFLPIISIASDWYRRLSKFLNLHGAMLD